MVWLDLEVFLFLCIVEEAWNSPAVHGAVQLVAIDNTSGLVDACRSCADHVGQVYYHKEHVAVHGIRPIKVN